MFFWLINLRFVAKMWNITIGIVIDVQNFSIIVRVHGLNQEVFIVDGFRLVDELGLMDN